MSYRILLPVFVFLIGIDFSCAEEQTDFPITVAELGLQGKNSNYDWNNAVFFYGCFIDELNKKGDDEKILIKLAEAYRCRAYAHFQTENLIRSLADIRMATSLCDRNLENIRANSKLYLYFQTGNEEFFEKSGIVSLIVEECTKNIEKLRQDLEKTPESQDISGTLALVYFLRGSTNWVNGPAMNAIGDFHKVKQYDPDDEIGLPVVYFEFAEAWPLVEELLKTPPDMDKIKNIVQKTLLDEKSGWFAKFLAHNEQAKAFYWETKYKKAAEEWSKANEIRPDIPIPAFRALALRNCGQCYLLLQDYEKAVSLFSESLQRVESMEAHWGRAEALHHAGHHNRAVAELTELIERFSIKNLRVYLLRADSLRELKRYEECLNDCNQVIVLNPQTPYGFMVKGLVFSEMVEYEKAVEQYTKALEIDPNNAVAHYSRGYLYYLLDELEKTQTDFERAAELDPNYREKYEEFNHAYRSIKDSTYPPEKAIEYLNECLKKEPNDAQNLANRALRYGQLKDYEKAFEDAEQAIQIQPENDYVIAQWMRIAFSFRYFNNNEENRKKIDERFMKYCKTSLDGKNEHISREVILIFRSDIFRERKEYEKALADFEEILEIVDSAPNTRLRCAYMNLHLAEKETDETKRNARIEKALQYADQVIESGLAAEKGSDYFCRGKVYESLGEIAKAEEDFRKAKEAGFQGDENFLYIFK